MNSLRLTDEEIEALSLQVLAKDPEATFTDFGNAVIDAQLAKLREQKPVARLLHGKEGIPGIEGREVARTYSECPKNLHHDYWTEGSPLFAAPVPGGQDGRSIAERITAKIEAMTPEQLAAFMQSRERLAAALASQDENKERQA